MTVKEYNQAVESYADGIYRFILKNLGDGERARDIVQETFEKLWRRVDEVNGEKVKSYLFSTAYHTMIDMIRKERRQTPIDQISPTEYAHDDQYSDLNEILHVAIRQLPDDQRSVVLLRDYEGYTYDEISKITGLSESQVKVYIYRARVFLKKYIGNLEKVI